MSKLNKIYNDCMEFNKKNESEKKSLQKSKWSCFCFALLYGCFGAHRFYVGKKGSAILYLLTFGLFGLGVFFDIISILNDTFTDVNYQPLV